MTDYSQVPIIQCTYRLTLDVQKAVAVFPKHFRGLGGERLSRLSEDLLDSVIKANFTRNPATRSKILDDLAAQVFSLRLKVRLAHDLKSLSTGQVTILNNYIEDIQRQLAGWSKWARSQKT